jgi:hypothetical protein
MTQWCDSIKDDTIYVSRRFFVNLKSTSQFTPITRLNPRRMVDNSFTTAGLLEAIKGLDSIECGAEARKHFGLAKSYRNFNHGIFDRGHQFIPSYSANPSHQAPSALIPPRSDLFFTGSRISQRNDQMSSSDTTIPNCSTSRARPLQSSSMLRSREPSSCPMPLPASTRFSVTLFTSLVM